MDLPTQQRQQRRVVIGPDANTGPDIGVERVGGEFGLQEEGGIVGHEHPSGDFFAPFGPLSGVDVAYFHPGRSAECGDGRFQIVWSAPEPVHPEPYPNTRTAAEWQAFLHDLYTGWGKQWVAPEAK